MEWIRVKDYPPNVEDFGAKAILIAVKGHEKFGSFVWPAVCTKVKVGEKEYYHYWLMSYDEIEGYINRRFVTHWAPFPKLPEGE